MPVQHRFAQSSQAESLGALLSSARHSFLAQSEQQPNAENPLKHLQLRSVLAAFRLESLYPAFEENEVDLEALMCMEEHDFQQLGASLGNRAKLRALQYRRFSLGARLFRCRSAQGDDRRRGGRERSPGLRRHRWRQPDGQLLHVIRAGILVRFQ